MEDSKQKMEFTENSNQKIGDVVYHVKSHFKEKGSSLYDVIKSSIKSKQFS